MTKPQTEKVVINSEALAKANGLKKGAEVSIEVRNGVPVSKYWRNRYRDARIDGCITVLSGEQSEKKTEKVSRRGE